ncbi:MAG: acyltransferase [Lachnospiraceae bacterium]|nr:acyltransferase [Lachnospiraceae bacterium]
MRQSSSMRQSNIEMLRILSMLGVIVLHYNNADIGGGFSFASPLNKIILYGFESLFICAVNVYLLISAYFLCKREERNWHKPVELLIQVMVFDAGLQVLRTIMGQGGFSAKSFLIALLPDNYFVILYIACYFISPMINIALKQMGKDKSGKFLLTCFAILSVWPTVVDSLQDFTGLEWTGLNSISISGSQGGYTIVNFLLVYAIGAYIGLYGFEAILGDRQYKTVSLWMTQVVMLVLIQVWAIASEQLGLPGSSAWDYCNPLVIAQAVLLFVIFTRLHIPQLGWLNGLAKGSFTVYLLHIPFLQFFGIESAVQKNALYMIGHMLGTAVTIYLICYVVYVIYEAVTRPIYKKLWRQG